MALLETLFALIQQHGVLAVVLAVVIEEVVAPIPSTPTIMGAAIILISPSLTFPAVLEPAILVIALPAAVAAMFSTLPWFFLAYYGGKPAIERWQRFLGITWEDVRETEQKLKKKHRDFLFVFFFRAIPVFPMTIVTLAAGLIRMHVPKYMTATFLSSFVRSLILALVAWKFHAVWESISGTLNLIERVVLVLIVIAILGLLWWKREHLPTEKIREKIDSVVR